MEVEKCRRGAEAVRSAALEREAPATAVRRRDMVVCKRCREEAEADVMIKWTRLKEVDTMRWCRIGSSELDARIGGFICEDVSLCL